MAHWIQSDEPRVIGPTIAGQQRIEQLRQLYLAHGAALEAEHWGEFLAVSQTGDVLLATTLHEAIASGLRAFGRGNVIFKIGERAVGAVR